MSKTIRTRITSLGRDISFLRLDEEELCDALTEDVGFFLLDEDEDTPYYIESDEHSVSLNLSKDIQQRIEYEKMLITLSATVSQFDDKISKELLEMTPAEAVEVLGELYVNAILFNPAMEPAEFEIFTNPEPMSEDLQRAIAFLPDSINQMIMYHGMRDYIEEDPFNMSEETKMVEELRKAIDVTFDTEEESVVLAEHAEIEIDSDKIKDLKTSLGGNVIGQEYAVDHMYSAVRRLSIGFRDKGRPPGVFLFVGPTGVGKTLMVKKLNEYLFSEGAHLARIDCAALAEKHSVSKLLGSPPGYVGYSGGDDEKGDDPSLLFKEISKLKNGVGVLLLDEIEKAHADIWDTMLTVFDEGYFKTSMGNIIDMRNVLIIMTSNLGTRELDDMRTAKSPLGFGCEAAKDKRVIGIVDVRDTAMEAIKKYMKPELVGRITEVVPFSDLDQENITKVLGLEWAIARDWLDTVEADIEIDDGMMSVLASKCLDTGYGARHARRMIEKYVIDSLAEAYLSNKVVFESGKAKLDVSLSEGNLVEIDLNGKNSFAYKVTELGEDKDELSSV